MQVLIGGNKYSPKRGLIRTPEISLASSIYDYIQHPLLSSASVSKHA